ncbi:MAG: hydrolase [Nocardia sp.]|uniref:NUDIX domain-containing protein n=1 Tax=Nocardia sp. TaxID=1821 RepID=UPI00262AF4FE|nr:NUDIX hydrolase [Nocardia sp.]MCU1640181.1 hydrolase [Nocardia sp.]
MDVLTSREIYSNQWITVREDIIRRPDGEQGLYAVVEKSDFAIIVPQDGDRFHLVEQFRHPLRQRFWEFPGGSVADRTLDPIEVARQELREETGLRAEQLTYLGRVAPAPATSTQYGSIYLATVLTEGPHEREPSEQDMRAAWFSRAELEALITEGVMVDAQSVAAYGLLLLHERNQR